MFFEKATDASIDIRRQSSEIIKENTTIIIPCITNVIGCHRRCFSAFFLPKSPSLVVMAFVAMILCGDFILVSQCSEQSNHGTDRANTFRNRSIFASRSKRNNNLSGYSQIIESNKENPLLSRAAVHAQKSFKDNNKEGLLQVPCSVAAAPSGTSSVREEKCTTLTAFVDTGATHTIMFYDTMKRTNLMHLMDRNPSFLCATSVGGEHVNIVGRIPAGLISLVLGRSHGSSNHQNFNPSSITLSPEIYVLERTGSQSVDLLLGLDVLNLCKARICLQTKCLILSHPSTLSSLADNNNSLLDAAGWATSFTSSSSEVNIPFISSSDEHYSLDQETSSHEEDGETLELGLYHRNFDLFSRRSKSKGVDEHDEWKDDALSDEGSHEEDTSTVGGSYKIFEKVMNDNDAKNVLRFDDDSQRDEDDAALYADDNDSPIDFSGM
jgi:hypothetical protein